MDSAFLVLLISGRTEKIKAERFELVIEPATKRSVYKFYGEIDQTSRCFFASEDIIGVIPEDMQVKVILP